MKLLVGNDDGVFAPGIRALANTLAEAGHEVIVVCPDRERSATGHGLTIHQPIRAEEVESVFHESVRAWACSGTPSDCIKLALGALLDTPPDLVLSGINQGANLGTDVLYSGTVSAAMEGVIEGIPSIAFSLTSFAYHDFGPSAQFALKMVSRLQQHPIDSPILFNVNIPAVPERDIQGVAFTRQGIRRYFDMFEKRIDPRGKTYYWLAGEVLEDAEMPPGFKEMAEIQTDVQANRHKQISITPLQYNLTLNQGFHDLEQWLKF